MRFSATWPKPLLIKPLAPRASRGRLLELSDGPRPAAGVKGGRRKSDPPGSGSRGWFAHSPACRSRSVAVSIRVRRGWPLRVAVSRNGNYPGHRIRRAWALTGILVARPSNGVKRFDPASAPWYGALQILAWNCICQQPACAVTIIDRGSGLSKPGAVEERTYPGLAAQRCARLYRPWRLKI